MASARLTSSSSDDSSPPASQLRQRQRRKAPKTRSGCITCKNRHVKCDEKRPYCLKCTSHGRVCEGYAIPKAWIFEASSTRAQRTPQPIEPEQQLFQEAVLSPSISQWKGSEYEERALAFFRLRTAVVLAAFTTTANYFWRNIVPQLSQTSITIRHSAIAASCLQEAVDYRPQLQDSIRRRHLFLKHYTQAISTLTDTSHPPSTEVVLTSCLLLLACENFQGSTLTGLVHVTSGLDILREYRSNLSAYVNEDNTAADSSYEVVTKHIAPIFARLEAQTKVYQAHDPKSVGFCDMNLSWARPEIPCTYVDLFHARDTLNEIMQWAFFQMRRYRQGWTADTPEFCIVKALLEQWSAAVFQYMAKLDNENSVESRTARTLSVHQTMFAMFLRAYGLPAETIWDEYADVIQELLTIIADLISYQERSPANDWSEYNNRLSLFEYDFGAIPPLFLIACHCRHPTLRRMALKLMRYLHRSEGAWDTCSAAKIAEGVMYIEERNFDSQTIENAADIPENCRIRALSAAKCPDNPGKVILSYKRYPYTDVSYEEIEWATWSRPELDSVTVWPLTDLIRLGGYQGLIRPASGTCICKAYGRPQNDRTVRVPGTNLVLRDPPRPLGLLSV